MRLAVISIRGGSQCIPNKNRQPLCCLYATAPFLQPATIRQGLAAGGEA